MAVSYLPVYAVNVLVHHGWQNALIPAAVPWAVAAGVALWNHRTGSLRWAWITLAGTTVFFTIPHVMKMA